MCAEFYSFSNYGSSFEDFFKMHQKYVSRKMVQASSETGLFLALPSAWLKPLLVLCLFAMINTFTVLQDMPFFFKDVKILNSQFGLKLS